MTLLYLEWYIMQDTTFCTSQKILDVKIFQDALGNLET